MAAVTKPKTDAELLGEALAWKPEKPSTYKTAIEIALKYGTSITRMDVERRRMQEMLDQAGREAWQRFAKDYTCPVP